MKEIILDFERNAVFENNPVRTLLLLVWFGAYFCVVAYDVYVGRMPNIILGVSNFIVLSILLSVTLRTRTLAKGKCILSVSGENISCKNAKGSLLWSLPLNRISHISCRVSGTGKWFSPKIQDTYVYTIDNESFGFPGLLNEVALLAIQSEIDPQRHK